MLRLTKQAAAAKQASPKLDVMELTRVFDVCPSVIFDLERDGAPINTLGKTDLFDLFDWLKINRDHPPLNAISEALLALWTIARNV
ncbi:hypothetical protein [Burkholderia latens]|uniref:hypothetical protein n=1 Tax=Burkholderia latens TaxID=488446 RepID=UPI0018D265BF|nr:hypothetical protein [Burkholderia latens]